MRFLRWLLGRRRDDVMSDAWLAELRQAERAEFHGVTWAWPVRKEGL